MAYSGYDVAKFIFDLSDFIVDGPAPDVTAIDEWKLKDLFNKIVMFKYGRKAFTVILVEEVE